MARLLACLFFILIALPASAAPCVYTGKDFGARALHRGINLSGWWEGQRSIEPSASDLSRLHRLGFDFVRLPISENWLEKDANAQQDILDDLHCGLVTLLNIGFTVIVDLHPSPYAKKDLYSLSPEEILQKLGAFWERLAPALEKLPAARVVLGLNNEPSLPTKSWWQIQEKLVHLMRKRFPHHRLVVSANVEDGLAGLARAVPYADKNLLYDFHFYSPMFFTHHGAEWITSQRNYGALTYPSDPKDLEDYDDQGTRDYVAQGWNRIKIVETLSGIKAWKTRYHVEVACLEFGVYRSHTDAQSRSRWLHDVRITLEDADIPWALWEYRGGFGLFDSGGNLDEDMAKALGLQYGESP